MKNDLISRQAAIDATFFEPSYTDPLNVLTEVRDRLKALPSAQPDLDEWCTDCKEYDQEKHCCPRWNRVIRKTAEEIRKNAEPRWIPVEIKPPKECKSYWVCTDTGYQCECRWTNNRFGMSELDEWGWSIFDIPQYTKVVAYMPLPKPYERSEE